MIKVLVCLLDKNYEDTITVFCYLDKTKDAVFILMKKRVSELYRKTDSYQVLETYINQNKQLC